MRRAAKIDGTQNEIVKNLRSCGMSVQLLHAVGQGCPDAVVGWRGINVFLEFKDGNKVPSAQKLTADEAQWHAKWAGQVATVATWQEAVNAVNAHWDECRGNVSRRCSITNSTLGQLKRDIPVEK